MAKTEADRTDARREASDAMRRAAWMLERARRPRMLLIGRADPALVEASVSQGVELSVLAFDEASVAMMPEGSGVVVRVEVLSSSELPRDIGAFDTVVLDGTLGDTLAPERVLAEVTRALAPGGVLILAEPYGAAGERDPVYLTTLERALRASGLAIHDLVLVGDEILVAAGRDGGAADRALFEVAEARVRALDAEVLDLRARLIEAERAAQQWERRAQKLQRRVARLVEDLRALRGRRVVRFASAARRILRPGAKRAR